MKQLAESLIIQVVIDEYNVGEPPQDALLGNRAVIVKGIFPGAVDTFTIPLENGTSITIPELPQFLATRGTSYCFFPYRRYAKQSLHFYV